MTVQPISATEAIAASLRERIFDGRIVPGERLPELELATSFGVARPTVRAAIQALCHEGLLQRGRNRSAVVPALTREDVLDLFSVRIPLECLIVRKVLERNVSLDGVREAIEPLAALTVSSPWSSVVEADLNFHRALARATGSPRLEKVYMSLGGEIRLCIAQLRPAWPSAAALADEHRAVLDVIEAGDVEASVRRMTEHLDRAVRDLSRLPR
ncbi:MAG: GntR family transcriptional regulator [Actinomycetia bacterium]|nr:GntR family transcriptional regulator [Actinomycetes bacterium]